MYLNSAIKSIKNPSSQLSIKDSEALSAFKSKTGKVFSKIKEPVPRYFESDDQLHGYYSDGEYDLVEIFKYLDYEAYFAQTVKKKIGLLTKSGYEIYSEDDKIKDYIKARFALMELQTNISFKQIVNKLAYYLIVSSNAYLIKTRSKDFEYAQSYEVNGKEMHPVTGYFLVHPTSMKPRYKYVKFRDSGQIKHRLILKEWLYVNKRGIVTGFKPEDVIHFAIFRDDGMTLGRPELIPVIDDIRTLRKLEEDVQLLAYRDLFPLIHYSIENPEMLDHNVSLTEIDQARRDMERMVQDGGIATDARHKIQIVGSNGKHLDVRPYIEYFQNRVFSGLGVSAADMGLGKDISGNTAQSMSKQLLDSVRFIQQELARMIDEEILTELMLQSPFGIEGLHYATRPTLKFEEIDIEWKIRNENHNADQFTKGTMTIDEVRSKRGDKKLSDEDLKRTFAHLYGDMSGLAVGKSAGATGDLIKSSGSNSNIVKSVRDSLNIPLELNDMADRFALSEKGAGKSNLLVDLQVFASKLNNVCIESLNDGLNKLCGEFNISIPEDSIGEEAKSFIRDSTKEIYYNVLNDIIDNNYNRSKTPLKINKRINELHDACYNLGYALAARNIDINKFIVETSSSKEPFCIELSDSLDAKEFSTYKSIVALEDKNEVQGPTKEEIEEQERIRKQEDSKMLVDMLKESQQEELIRKFDPMEARLADAVLYIDNLSKTVSDLRDKLEDNDKKDDSEVTKLILESTNKQVEGFLATISELKDQTQVTSSKYMEIIERILKSIDGLSQDNISSIRSIVESIPKEINVTSAPVEVKVDNPPVDVNISVQDKFPEPKKK